MSSINNIALNNLQDYKQYISLMRRKALSRAENNKDYQEVNSLYRLIKISDFMLCTIEQFSLEELEDLDNTIYDSDYFMSDDLRDYIDSIVEG